MNTITRVGIVTLIVVVGVAAFIIRHTSSTPTQPIVKQLIATTSYMCSGNKAITASYYTSEDKSVVDANQQPIPGGSVSLDVSGGNTLTLPQVISADGTRYANTDESIVFWSKGNGATFTENRNQTHVDCIQISKDPGNLSHVYADTIQGFSMRYPEGVVIDASYQYQAFGPGKDIDGTKFTIPTTFTTGTNLSSDSYISVEKIPQVMPCTASLFLDKGVTVHTVEEGNTVYSMASSTGAAAGNRYEETVYAIQDMNSCVAIRYFIHYGVIQNYPTGTVREFNKQNLLDVFDAMRHTLVIAG